MALTLHLGPLVALQQQLARAAIASGIAVYAQALVALVLLTGSVLHPAGLLLLVPILVAEARAVRNPARLLVDGRLARAYRTFFRLEMLYIVAIWLAAGPDDGGPAGAFVCAIVAAGTAKPIVTAQRLSRAVETEIRAVQDRRVLLACLEKDVRGTLAARVRSFAGNRTRVALPWAAGVAAGAGVAIATVLVLAAIGLEPNNAVAMPAAIAGVWTFFRATRHATPAAAHLRAHDQRPPVLLLRQFSDDELKAARTTPGGPTFEHFLAGELRRMGPAISVGRPGERLQPLGASRDYLAGDWRQGVQTLINDAALVVFLLGESDNLLWELNATIAARGAASALVVIPPLVDRTELERRWARFVDATAGVAGPVLPRALPREPVVAVFFTTDGAVMMMAEKHTTPRTLVSHAMPEYRVALRLYEQIRRSGLTSSAGIVAFTRGHVPLVRGIEGASA